MPGTSSGLGFASFIGCRLLRECVYVPGYNNGQKTLDPKIYIPVAVNSKEGKRSIFQLTAWGDKITSLFAHYLRTGKEMHFLNCVLTTFPWQQTSKEGTLQTNDDGSPLMFDRFSFVVKSFVWGSDSAKTIEADLLLAQQEVAQGLRGPNWNIPGHADNIAWRASVKAKASMPYQGGEMYGYARVSKAALNAQATNAYMLAGAQGTMANNINAVTNGMPTVNAASVAANVAPLNVNGYTYDSLIAAGATREQILANPQFAVLVTAHDIAANNPAMVNPSVLPVTTAPTAPINPATGLPFNPATIYNAGAVPMNSNPVTIPVQPNMAQPSMAMETGRPF